MNRENVIDRILYSYFLEQIFSVATGRLDRLLSCVNIILGSSVIVGIIPRLSCVIIVIVTVMQVVYSFGKKSGTASCKAAEYLQLYDDQSEYNDSELKYKLKMLEKTDENIWSPLKDIAILKTQIKVGIPKEQRIKLSVISRMFIILC